MIGFFAGNLLLSLTPAHQIYWAMLFPAFCVVTLGPDLSFASATIIISNVVHHDEQAVGGSFVNTVVLYSHGFGMGIAGCVQRYVQQDSSNELLSVHSVLWFAVGVDVISFLVVVLLSATPATCTTRHSKRSSFSRAAHRTRPKFRSCRPMSKPNVMSLGLSVNDEWLT